MSTIRVGLTGTVGPAFERESIDFQPVAITLDGAVTTDPSKVEISLTTGSARPTTWSQAILLSGDIGFMVQGLDVGVHTVWARVTDNPVTAVEIAGKIVVR